MQTNQMESPDYLEKTVAEIDIDLTKLDYLYTYFFGIFNRIKYLSNSKRRRVIKTRFLQLDFIARTIELSTNLNAENRAYLVLGAIQYSQGRWGKFPRSGPLYELILKQKDLEQMLSAYASEINLELLLDQPNLIREKADEKFARFLGEKTELIRFSLKDSSFNEFVAAARKSK